MSDVKQVKVDNWGIYFLQRLKHFFNRTDYCDLTLQFQNNAQLKVHRLVLNACTEYFELLERTCEMYEDCLVMPDDLQADVVVPIVNFMYTGQLEFKLDMLEKLYQTSLVMNMPVLSKLLEAHRPRSIKSNSLISYSSTNKRNKNDLLKSARSNSLSHQTPPRSASYSNKRSYGKAFQSNNNQSKEKTVNQPIISPGSSHITTCRATSPIPSSQPKNKKAALGEPRPTRYELPEELDTDNVFENSFCNISYTSKPLMVHPETTKYYPSKKNTLFGETSISKQIMKRTSTMDIVECRKITQPTDNIFDDDLAVPVTEDSDVFHPSYLNIKDESPKDPNQLFDQILDTDSGPKVIIETKDNKQASNVDHAKIISEVLKKYPHLVKSNKNIKLKILNTPKPKKQRSATPYIEEKEIKSKSESQDYTFETDILDSKEAAKLIAMGASNIRGPWICLICGTPGRALHFPSYYKFRRHLVEVHNEKPIPTICEYCGFKSFKRNYMVHHCYTKHGVEPPPQYQFPKCNQCSYVAITEGFLIKHKLSHAEARSFRCNVCSGTFGSASHLLSHIQKTGHKYSAERKNNLQCIYCMKVFLREANLCAHLKTHHKTAAIRDGIVDDSDDEKSKLNDDVVKPIAVKYEVPVTYDNENEDTEVQFQIQQRPDGIHIVSKKPQKQKILNPGFNVSTTKSQKNKPIRNNHNEFMQDNILIPENTLNDEGNIVLIDDNEYIMKNNQLIPRNVSKSRENDYILPEIMETEQTETMETLTPSTSMEYSDLQNVENMRETKMMLKKSNMNQPIQIVVSNEEEYKALMASNHSIIFDDGNSNKTLTVMTTPHDTAIDTETTIDLDNTQSNDMMIIQEDYPLNVSEAVATNNSNIVVVYSHQMTHVNDDTNKQYQIISSQDIGTQYVQSSAIITQNFETVTTSTPVMSAHVIGSQVDESWQTSGQQNVVNQQVHITSEAHLQSIVANQIKNNSTDHLIELPEVQLIPEISKNIPGELNVIDNNLNQTAMSIEEVVQTNSEQVIIEEMQNVSTPQDSEIPCDTNKEIVESQNSEISNSTNQPDLDSETITQNVVSTTIPNQIDAQLSMQNHEDNAENTEETMEQCIEQTSEETIELEQEIESEISTQPHIPLDVEETENTHDNVDTVTQESVDVNPINNKESTTSNISKEQIEHLTSEWSEDEFEVATTQELNETEKNPNSLPEKNTEQVAEESQELEETIENIQQEVEKQVLDAAAEEEDGNLISYEISNSTNTEGSEQTQTIVTTQQVEVTPPQEKLSSLLNDWEDNDSQEEANASTNENNQENVNTQEVTTDVCSSNDTETNKDNNIKSLVSDWDDDEEENRE